MPLATKLDTELGLILVESVGVLLMYVGWGRGGRSLPWLLPALDFGRMLLFSTDAGSVGGPIMALSGRLPDLVL